MTAGLLQTQIQNFRFKSLFSKMSLFIHDPTLIHQLVSLSSTRGMTNCIGTEGVKSILTNRSWHKVCRHIDALKGNLTSSMLQDRSSKQIRRFERWLCIFKMILSTTGCYYSGTARGPKHGTKLWLLPLTNNCKWGCRVQKQWNDKKKKR